MAGKGITMYGKKTFGLLSLLGAVFFLSYGTVFLGCAPDQFCDKSIPF